MTSTIQQYTVGTTYPTDEVYPPHGEWCGAHDNDYICTIRRGHEGDHVGAMGTGEVVHTWPSDDLARFRRRVRELAETICRNRGYGTWPAWNDTMVRLGLEPFTTKTVRVVAPVPRAVYTFDQGYTEEQAREWLDRRGSQLFAYLHPVQEEVGEATVEVTEDTPRDDESVEAEDDADTEDLDTYKALVRRVAIQMATEQSWCDDGLNGVLDELGLDRKSRDYTVEVVVTARQTVYVTVTAQNEDDANDQVDTDTVRDRIDRYDWQFDSDDWEITETNEA